MSGFTRTTNYNLYKPTSGADDDLWGDHWNWNADTLDSTVHGMLPLSGGTVTGPTAFNGGNSASTATAFLQANQNVFGVSPAGGQQAAWYAFNVGSDTADTTTAQGGGGTGTYFGNIVSAGAKGGRTGQSTLLYQAGVTTCPVGQYYVASGAFAEAHFSAGGTAGSPQGSLFASNIGCTLDAPNWLGACGLEIDIGVTAGHTAVWKNGLVIVQYTNDAVQGSVTDASIMVANQSGGTAPGWKVGIQFGGNTGWWPFGITSTLIGTQAGSGGPPMQALNGIDFSAIAFTAYAFNTTGYSVANDGHVTCNRGLAFGGHVATGVTDYSHHIDLYNTQVGICIDSGTSSTNYGSFATHNFTNASGTMMANINPTAVTSATAMQIGGTLGPTWTTGSGVPSSTQPVGSIYSRVSTWAAGATLYVSKGAGAWTAVASV